MGLSKADTIAKLVDCALHSRWWTEDLFRREETAGDIEIIEGKLRKQAKRQIDYTLRVRANLNTQPIPMANIVAKAADLPLTRGLERAELNASPTPENPLCFLYQWSLLVEYSRITVPKDFQRLLLAR